MRFNRTTFLVPINNDTTLKLRDVNGKIVYYIKNPNCTTAVNNNIIKIKQLSEAKIIILKFDSNIAAIEAHKLLRNSLTKLKNNLKNNTKSYHLYEQINPATVWNIEHNINRLVSVTIYDDNNEEIIGDITIIDNNNVQVNFNTPTIGKAIII